MINIPNVLNDYVKTTELDNYVQTDELANELTSYVTTDKLTDDLEDYVTQTQNIENKKLELDLIVNETLDQDEELYWYPFDKPYKQVLCELKLGLVPGTIKGSNIILINNMTLNSEGELVIKESRTDLGFYNFPKDTRRATYTYEQNIYFVDTDSNSDKPYNYELLLTCSNYQSWNNWLGEVLTPGNCMKKLNGKLEEFKGIGFQPASGTYPYLPVGTTIKIWAK